MPSSASGIALTLLSLSLGPTVVILAQESAVEPAGLRQVGSLIEFSKDIQPILREKCLQCHGPEEAKNDFRVDDADSMLGYVEPGDLESSSLWTDYLVTEDADTRMPPLDTDGVTPLTGTELAAFRLWIEEGAPWSAFTVADAEAATAPPAAEPVRSLAARIWSFQGLFHPASVHFPIALLSLSGVFVLFSYFNRESFEPAAFHCLWIGTLGAIAACVMGWSYGQHEGYGAGYSFDLNNSAIDRHRWLGIAVAVLGFCLMLIANSVRKNRKSGLRAVWLLGSLVMAGAVSMTGYQGGELTYGEDHYAKEFQRLFPSATETAPPQEMPENGAPQASDSAAEEPTAQE